MSGPLFDGPDPEITQDLARKLGCDIAEVISRTLEIAPPDELPIITTASVAAIYYLAKHLESRVNIDPNEPPLNRSLIVASLLAARMAIHKNISVAMEEALADGDALEAKGRV
jgi:hypothetical protein